MAEIRTVTTLRYKRDEIEASIRGYEKKLLQAQADLAHINAAITIFEASESRQGQATPPYVDLHRFMKRGEAMTLCKEALAVGPLSTRQLAAHIMRAKGMDAGDVVLGKAIASRLIHSLRQQWRRGMLEAAGRKGAVRIWRLPA